MSTVITGYDERIIAIEGDITEIFDASPVIYTYLSLSDGTVIQVSYDTAWRLSVIVMGRSKVEITKGINGIPDVVRLDGEKITWAHAGVQFARK